MHFHLSDPAWWLSYTFSENTFCQPNVSPFRLQYQNPPSRVRGAPEFAKTKKRESYFQEFCNVTEKFQENRVKAHRLSDEAASLAMQVEQSFFWLRAGFVQSSPFPVLRILPDPRVYRPLVRYRPRF